MASLRRIRRRSCENKKAYSQSKAACAAKKLKIITGNPNYCWYKCDFCKQWHVGRSSYYKHF